LASLDQRATRLDKVAELRKQHKRAGDLTDREEGQTRRGQFSNNRGVNSEDASNDGGFGSPNGNGDPRPGDPGPIGNPDPPASPPIVSDANDAQLLAPSPADIAALAESSTVLGDVIDATAIESLRKAQASSDPAVRAAAAKKARDAASAKLEQLRKHRAAIEARARGLRGGK
jgi:hypothetical protein